MTRDEAFKQLISTPEGRVKLAASMVQPTRCPGIHYDEEGRAVLNRPGKKIYAKWQPPGVEVPCE